LNPTRQKNTLEKKIGFDGLLLKLLYHPRLKAGMREQEVRPIICKIIAKWIQDGTIEQPNQSISQGKLTLR